MNAARAGYRRAMADPTGAGEHQSEVRIPVSLGVVGPDVLVATAMTVVALGVRTLRVEGPTPLAPGDVVALAADLPTTPGQAVDGPPPAVLAVAVVTGPSEAVDGATWRTRLHLQQIDGADGERLAAVATRAGFGGGRR